MAYFRIEDKVFDHLPQACFGAVVARGIDNSAAYAEIAALLTAETAALRERLAGAELKEHPGILPYRDAFQRLGVNPNKYMSSIEALSKRVLKGAELPRINPIVDLSSALSLKYLLPMGAHDLGKMEGDFEVRLARAEDHFLPFGETAEERPESGEIVYASGNTVKTRRWIWRQSEDGKIDSSSREIIFPIDGFIGINDEAVLSARDELAQLIQKIFGCETQSGFLTRDNPEMQI